MGGPGMRGRKPRALAIRPAELAELERIAHCDSSPWYRVRRARILLGIASGQRREDLASPLECDPSTVWRACQPYRDTGLAGLLAHGRPGRPRRDPGLTPPQRGQNVGVGCPGP